jgi:biopolymer transport protein ExbD
MAGRMDDGGDELTETHEINVTPFIDVMLVLLIIFMVAAPLSTVDVAVDLPVATAKPQPRPDKPLFLTIKADLALALGNDPVARSSLGAALDAATNSDRDKRLFLRADKTVAYGEIMKVLNLLRTTGYLKVALVGLESGDMSDAMAPAIGALKGGEAAGPLSETTKPLPRPENR